MIMRQHSECGDNWGNKRNQGCHGKFDCNDPLGYNGMRNDSWGWDRNFQTGNRLGDRSFDKPSKNGSINSLNSPHHDRNSSHNWLEVWGLGRKHSDYEDDFVNNVGLWSPANLNSMMDHMKSMDSMFRRHYFHDDTVVKESDRGYEVSMSIPGSEPRDVSVDVRRNADGTNWLDIQWQCSKQSESKYSPNNGSDHIMWKGKSWCSGARSMPLPSSSNPDNIKADMRNGVLNITIPKSNSGKRVSSNKSRPLNLG